MTSESFDRFMTRLRRDPPPEHADPLNMRSRMDRAGGRLPEGVLGTPTTCGGVKAEWIDSANCAADRVVLYLHGGGCVAGSVDSHRNLTGHLAQAIGCRVLALEYRLAPEHPHPAQVNDAVGAFRALLDQGFQPKHIAVAGDSAGGGLTVSMLLMSRAHGLPMPAAAVAISPLVDLEATGSSMTSRASADPLITRSLVLDNVALFIGEGDRHDPWAAPMYGDLTGLPPMLIQVGDAEILLDDAVRLAACATKAGVETTLEVWPDMVHVFQASAGFFPEADEAIERIASFCRSRLGLPAE
jgi:epsilon-lactone hydrolase